MALRHLLRQRRLHALRLLPQPHGFEGRSAVGLLAQPDGFHGFLAALEPHHLLNPAVGDRPQDGLAHFDLQATRSAPPAPGGRRDHVVVRSIHQLQAVLYEVFHGRVSIAEETANAFVAPIGAAAHCREDRRSREVPLDVRVIERKDGPGVTAARSLVDLSDDLHALSAHRPRSFPGRRERHQ
jgi:hypothetical protein